MKRILTFACLIPAALMLGACGSSDSETGPDAEATPSKPNPWSKNGDEAQLDEAAAKKAAKLAAKAKAKYDKEHSQGNAWAKDPPPGAAEAAKDKKK